MKKLILTSVVALSVFVGAQSVSAFTAAEVETLITLLGGSLSSTQVASLRALATPSTPAVSYTRQMGVGATGADVSALQSMLISKGYLMVAAPTGYFGTATQAAVVKYQAANGITPASGYVGPMTLAKLNASVVVVPPTGGDHTVVTGGDEGQLKNIDSLGGVEASVEEGETGMEVLGFEVEADDSDMTITRVDVDFTETSSAANSNRLSRYFDTVYLMVDGEKVADMDASDLSEDDDVYSARFTGLNITVDEGDTADIYVAVDVVDSIDTNDEDAEWTVEIPENGIRATDTAGISDTYVTSSENTDLTEDFAVNGITGVELTLSKDSSSPDADSVEADDEDSTDDVTLLVLKVKAEGSDITLNDLPITLTTSEGNLNDVVSRVYLYAGSELIDDASVTSTDSAATTTFDMDEYVVEEDETVKFTVKVDVQDIQPSSFDNGTTLSASFTASNAVALDNAEDVQGDTVTSITGTATGEDMTFYADGISVKFLSATEEVGNESDTYVDAKGTYVLKFSVTAFGEDAYIASTTGLTSGSDKGVEFSVIGATLGGTATTTSNVSSTADRSDSNASYYVPVGETETFTLTVTILNGTAASGYFGISLDGVRFNDDDSATIGDYALVTSGLEDAETEEVYLQ